MSRISSFASGIARFVKKSGDTMTGKLTVSNGGVDVTGDSSISGNFTFNSGDIVVGTPFGYIRGTSFKVQADNGLYLQPDAYNVGIGTFTLTEKLNVGGNLNMLNNSITAIGKINVATGSNASAGTATLSTGTVTVSTTAVTANSLIFLTVATATLTNVGVLSVSAKSAGTSFTVTSTDAADTATFNWLIIN